MGAHGSQQAKADGSQQAKADGSQQAKADGSQQAKAECDRWAVPGHEHWDKARESLTASLLESVEELELRIASLIGSRKFGMGGLKAAIDDHYGTQTELFFTKLFPFMVDLALRLPTLLQNDYVPPLGDPGCISLLLQGKPGYLKLPRRVVASLMANLFLGTLPPSPDRPFQSNMQPLIDCPRSAGQEVAKVRCFLNYFQRLAEMGHDPEGFLYIRRQQLPESYNWMASEIPLCAVEVIGDGGIEDATGSLQADFANCHLGGGVIEGGCVQEEIRFAINPELTCAMMFCQDMTDLEAIVLTGAERFSDYDGYAFSLRYGGNHVDETPRDDEGTVRTAVTAIDAIPYFDQLGGQTSLELQLQSDNMMRDASKALVGFMDFSSDESELECSKSKYQNVATGNWGCGAFGGNIHVKFLIQWCAVSVSGRSMKYYTFEKETEKIGVMMKGLVQGLTEKNVSVGQLWQVMEKLTKIAEGQRERCNIIPALGKYFGIEIQYEGETPDIPSD